MSDRRALYVRLPAEAADTLDRAAAASGTSKQDLVAGLIVGRADLREEPADVLTLEQAAALLQTTDDAVRAAAQAGDLPGRELGGEWRFARAAVLAWLTP